MNACKPTCGKFHAYDCPNNPGAMPSKWEHPHCSDCRHERQVNS